MRRRLLPATLAAHLVGRGLKVLFSLRHMKDAALQRASQYISSRYPAPPGRRRTTNDDIGGEHESPPSLKKTQTAGYLVGLWQSQAQGSRGTNMRQVLNAFRPIGPLFMHSAHLSGKYTLWEF
jgi:hypothetical protein